MAEREPKAELPWGETLFRTRKAARRARWPPPEKQEVLAHGRALDLMRGRQLSLRQARVLRYNGRRPEFTQASEWGCYPDDLTDAEEHFEVDDSELDEAMLPGYSSKELVVWAKGLPTCGVVLVSRRCSPSHGARLP